MESSWLNTATVIATILATLIGFISLLFYFFVEKEKASKFYAEMRTRLQSIFGSFSGMPSTIVRGLRVVLTFSFFMVLIYFIVIVPIFLYEQIYQTSSAVSSSTNETSVFYILIIAAWCMSIITINQALTIDKLRDQINYLNRIPGIKELKNQYNRNLFESAIQQWDDFRTDLVSKHDNSPFALDIAACSLLDVQDEILIIGCPNPVIHKRMYPRRPSASMDDSEYQEKLRDKESIEALIKERFKIIGISYTLNKQLK